MPIVANKEGWGGGVKSKGSIKDKRANESSEINHQSLEPSLYSSIDFVGYEWVGNDVKTHVW